MRIGLHQLESHATPAQLFERIAAVLAFHVQHRHGLWYLVARRVVVAYDEVYMALGGICHFVHRLDAAVQCDDQIAAFLLRGVYAFKRDTVSLAVAVGYIVDDIVGLGTQKRVHQCHGRCAVHVIVAVYHDAFVSVYGAAQPVYGGTHIAHQERIVQTLQRRAYLRSRFGGGTQTATGQYATGQRTDLQVCSQSLCRRLLLSRQLFYVPTILQNLLPFY